MLNGWGLTETSPVLACRSMTTGPNIRGSVGRPLPGTRVRVVDPGSREEVPDGTQGLLLASGPGLMSGYWNDALGTAAVLLESQGQRWFDTGDLGWKVPEAGGAAAGALVLSGECLGLYAGNEGLLGGGEMHGRAAAVPGAQRSGAPNTAGSCIPQAAW